MNHPFRRTLAACAVLLAGLAQAEIVLVDSQIPAFTDPTGGGTAIADFDGDGLDDVAIAGFHRGMGNQTPYTDRRSGMLTIAHFDAAEQRYRFHSALVAEDALANIAMDPSTTTPTIIAVSLSGEIVRLGGRPLKRVVAAQLMRAVSDMAIADVDADGRADLVITHPQAGIAVYDLATLAVKPTSYPMVGSKTLAIAQLDADPALEIIMGGTPGRVIDGATGATDWIYAGGFGDIVTAGRIFPGGRFGFVGAPPWGYLSGFRGSPFAPDWSIKTLDSGSVTIADIDGDGIGEIFHSGYQGGMQIIDATTLASRRIIGINALGHPAIGRFEGGSEWLIAYGSNMNSTYGDALTILSSNEVERVSRMEENGPFSVTTKGDLDGDGRDEAAWMSMTSASQYESGLLHAFDSATGQELWTSELLMPGQVLPFSGLDLQAIAMTPYQSAAHRDLVVARGRFDPAIDVIDGITRRIRISNLQPGLNGQTIRHLGFAGNGDVLTGSHATNFGVIRIGRFAKANLAQTWVVSLPTASGMRLNHMKWLAASPSAPERLVLSTTTQLIMWNLETRLPIWSIAQPSQAADLWIDPQGVAVVISLAADGVVRKFSQDGSPLPGSLSVGTDQPSAIVVNPGNRNEAFACVDRRVVQLRLDGMAIVDQSPTIGASACPWGNLHATIGQHPQQIELTAGSGAGIFTLRATPDALFAHGFDGVSGATAIRPAR